MNLDVNELVFGGAVVGVKESSLGSGGIALQGPGSIL